MKNTRSILFSFDYAIQGVIYALRTQRNMRIHVAAAVLVLLAAAILDVDRMGLAAIVFAIAFVIAAELINTALEAAVDLATEGFDPLAKTAKDVAAGAVLVAAMNALVVAYLVLFDPLRNVAEQGLQFVETSAADLTVIALSLVLLAVLVLKAMHHERSFMHGGWPSGHTALAFGVATAIAFASESAGVLVLGYFLALLVAQSRVEAEIHTVWQVVAGALIGILLVTAVFQVFFQ